MKNFPLSVQIWLVFAGLTLFIFTMIAVFLPWTLRNFFDRQLYDILQDSQKSLTLFSAPADGPSPGAIIYKGTPFEKKQSGEVRALPGVPAVIMLKPSISAQQGTPVIRHFIISDSIKLPPPLPAPFDRAVEKNAREQQEDVKTYSQRINDETLFYVIRKEVIQDKPGYMVSFAWSNYRNELVMSMYIKLLLLMGILFLLIWPASLWLARYLTRPLVQMESYVSRIAERDWHEPIVTERKDEIGRLSRSFENMRRRLVRQDRTQQTFLQHISHELKTPVMVIRSYAQSILDGIYPGETLDESVKVINSEAGRLEKRVHDLLYLTKLNYLNTREKKEERFDFAGVILERVERHRYRRPEIEWEINTVPALVNGDRDQWGVAVENILDNQIRYAARNISVTLEAGDEETGRVLLRIWNDGPPLDPDMAGSLFEPYKTGENGQFGLGLTIVRQVTDLHRGRVWAAGEDGGTAFYIEMGTPV